MFTWLLHSFPSRDGLLCLFVHVTPTMNILKTMGILHVVHVTSKSEGGGIHHIDFSHVFGAAPHVLWEVPGADRHDLSLIAFYFICFVLMSYRNTVRLRGPPPQHIRKGNISLSRGSHKSKVQNSQGLRSLSRSSLHHSLESCESEHVLRGVANCDAIFILKF